MDYPWYEIVIDNSIEQGDFVKNCPIFMPPPNIVEGEILTVDVNIADTIILSQSCDLLNNHIKFALVCPLFTLTEWLSLLPPEQQNKRWKEKQIEALKRGNISAYHLLNISTAHKIDDFMIVDFRDVYGIHVAALRDHLAKIDTKQRLLSPYKEHLSQAFARYFMRVGLPQDLVISGY